MSGIPAVQYVVASRCAYEERPATSFAMLIGQPHDDCDRLRAELTAFFWTAERDYMVDLDRAILQVIPGVSTADGFEPHDREHARRVLKSIEELAA